MQSSPAGEHAGVLVIPPLLYLGAVAAGLLLEWLAPLGWRAAPLTRAAGIGLVAAGLALAGWARRTFRRLGTDVHPRRPTTALAWDGPYRFTRNPMYVGLTAGYVGLALATSSIWTALLLIPVAILMHWGVVRREERYLDAKFGESYRAFRSRVRRYL